jgi:hypothetical protein
MGGAEKRRPSRRPRARGDPYGEDPHFSGVANAFCPQQGQGLWVPACAGTTYGRPASNMPLLLAARCARVMPGTSAPGGAARPSKRGRGATLKKGRGECRVPDAPAASCAHGSGRCARVFTASSPESPGIPARNGFTAYFVISPAIGFFATVISRIKVLPGPVEPNEPPQDLTPASRRQDHTTSPYASAPSSCVPEIAHGEQSALRPHRTPDAAASTASHPASVTIAIRPSCGTRQLWIGR